MKSKLLITLTKIVSLLTECGYDEKARWFSQERVILQKLQPHSPEFFGRLGRLKEILVGMGSFSDLPLYPKPGSKWSIEQLRARTGFINA